MKETARVWWCGLALLRVVWLLWPQRGYIHPDEFFQSTEVAAGDVFHLDVLRTWEFTGARPIRSIVPIGIICAPAFSLLLLVDTLLGSSAILTPYTLLVSSRFTVTILSFISDYFIYNISITIGQHWYMPLIAYASSYVTLVYYTRTFSNTIESFLLAALLCCILQSIKKEFMKTVDSQDSCTTSDIRCSEKTEKNKLLDSFESVRQKKPQAPGTIECAGSESSESVAISESAEAIKSDITVLSNEQVCNELFDLTHSVDSNKPQPASDGIEATNSVDSCVSYMQYIRISFIVTLGTFNRPTFVFFAAVPVLYWLLFPVLVSSSSLICTLRVVICRSCVLAVYISVWLFLFVTLDSLYYGSLSFAGSFASLQYSLVSTEGLSVFLEQFGKAIVTASRKLMFRNLTVTPFNFILYNLASDNLAEHGIHPRVTHTLVNMPLLFNVLAVGLYLDVAHNIFLIVRARLTVRLFITSFLRPVAALKLTCIVSVFLLSVFPHQEARFLIPLLVPLVILYGQRVLSSKVSLAVWLVANIACSVLFGVLHQGGVVPSLLHLSEYSSTYPNRVEAIVYWKTYMPPRHLLMRCAEGYNSTHRVTDEKRSLSSINCSPSYVVHDLAGESSNKLITLLQSLHEKKGYTPVKDILVIFPATVYQDILPLLREGIDCSRCPTGVYKETGCEVAPSSGRLDLTLVHSSFPHLSMEDTPVLSDVTCENLSYIDCFYKQLALNIYNVTCAALNIT